MSDVIDYVKNPVTVCRRFVPLFWLFIQIDGYFFAALRPISAGPNVSSSKRHLPGCLSMESKESVAGGLTNARRSDSSSKSRPSDSAGD